MRRLFILSILFSCISTLLNAQSKKFDKKFGYFEYELVPMQQIVDSQNNHIVAGLFRGAHKVGNTTIQSRGDVDFFIIKYDASNNIVWVKTIGSSAGENLSSLSCDKDGNILLTGSFSGNVFYASANDSLQFISAYPQTKFALKLNPTGTVKWAKRFSGATSGVPADRSEIFSDHLGRVYLIHTSRAVGTLNSWQFQDSVIANPTNNYINVPRWMMMRLDEETGNLKWLNYIANPIISGSTITYTTISRPVVDSRNYINFVVTYDGRNIEPIYILGQYAAVNPRINNVLIKIDSLGVINRFRDLGAGNTYVSDPSELAITKNDELVLINKKASGSENGITYNYVTNPQGINYARIYDSTFSLIKIAQLGSQSVSSFNIDKQNRLITLGTSSTANFNVNPVNETIRIDSTKSVTFNTQSQVYPYYIRYNTQFKADTFFLENNAKPLSVVPINWNAIRISKNGDIIPSIIYGTMNNVRFRYDSTFTPINTSYGKQRDKEDPIISLIQDDRENIYTIGIIQAKTLFTRVSGPDSLSVPYENGSDAYISKYDSIGNIIWIKTFGSTSNESIKFLKKTSTGLFFIVQTTGTSNILFDNNISISGKINLVKIDFDGNFLWSKSIYSLISGANPDVQILKPLKNGNILLGINIYNDFYYDGQRIDRLGNRPGETILIINETNGSIIKYNRFALRDETFSYFSNVLKNAHEDDRGNLYFSTLSSINNINSPATSNQLYSNRTNTVTFTQNNVYQTGLLKIDTNLEIVLFKQFLNYSYLYDINGQGSKIYIAGIARNNQFIFGDTTIGLNSLAENRHFTNYLAVLDTNFRFNKVMKYDTSTIIDQINTNSRKILINSISKDIYQTTQFTGKIKIDSSRDDILSKGGNDLLFLKYDSLGNLLGGQQLGTPQNDFFLDAIINKKGNLIFASQAVDPNYNSFVVKKATSNISSISQSNETPNMAAFNVNNSSVSSITSEDSVNKDLLTPDNYLSQYSSLKEIGYNPDTTLSVSKTAFCKGDSAILIAKEVTDIKWKKNNQLISGATDLTFKPKSSGKYKAILTTIENRIDSTREIDIVVEDVVKPTVSDLNYCIGATTSTLSATTNSGYALKWYGSSSTGGIATNTAPTPSATNTGSIDYYVSQASTTTGCESDRTKISVVVNPKPNNPTVSNITTCVGLSPIPLTASVTSGNTLKWYGTSATLGTATNAAPSPSTTSTGTFDYYVSQASISTGCESDRSKITLVVNPTPAKPTVSDVTYCVGAITSTLSATAITGNELKWYGATASGGTASNSAPTPSSSSAGTFEYYVSQAATNTGCESERSKIIMLVNPTPSKPTVSNINSCIGSPEISLTVAAGTGNELKWYGTSASGGTATNTAPKPSTASIGNFDYYVSQSSKSTGCESDRSKITLSVYGIPSAPEIKRDIDNYLVSSYNTGNLWYREGVSIADTSQKFKPTIPGKYSVITTQNGCNSVQSNAYYYLITDIMNLSDFEFIKLAPNPFANQLNLDFVVKDIQKLNMEVFDISTGNKVATLLGLMSGSKVNLDYLSAGTYYVKISSLDNKSNYQFKMIKL